MKKLVLIFTIFAVLFAYSTTAALASSVYLEGLSGDWSFSNPSTVKGDSSGFLIGATTQFNAFTLGIEYLSGSFDDFWWDDFSSYLLKGGYQVFDNGTTTLNISLSYFSETIDYIDDSLTTDIDGFMLGADTSFSFSDRSSLLLSVAFSCNGEVSISNGSKSDADLIIYNLKYNYLFTDNWGGSLGYRGYLMEFPEPDVKLDLNTFTAGITYKF